MGVMGVMGVINVVINLFKMWFWSFIKVMELYKFFKKKLYIVICSIIIILSSVYWSLYKIAKEYSWNNFNKSEGFMLTCLNISIYYIYKYKSFINLLFNSILCIYFLKLSYFYLVYSIIVYLIIYYLNINIIKTYILSLLLFIISIFKYLNLIDNPIIIDNFDNSYVLNFNIVEKIYNFMVRWQLKISLYMTPHSTSAFSTNSLWRNFLRNRIADIDDGFYNPFNEHFDYNKSNSIFDYIFTSLFRPIFKHFGYSISKPKIKEFDIFTTDITNDSIDSTLNILNSVNKFNSIELLLHQKFNSEFLLNPDLDFWNKVLTNLKLNILNINTSIENIESLLYKYEDNTCWTNQAIYKLNCYGYTMSQIREQSSILHIYEIEIYYREINYHLIDSFLKKKRIILSLIDELTQKLKKKEDFLLEDNEDNKQSLNSPSSIENIIINSVKSINNEYNQNILVFKLNQLEEFKNLQISKNRLLKFFDKEKLNELTAVISRALNFNNLYIKSIIKNSEFLLLKKKWDISYEYNYEKLQMELNLVNDDIILINKKKDLLECNIKNITINSNCIEYVKDIKISFIKKEIEKINENLISFEPFFDEVKLLIKKEQLCKLLLANELDEQFTYNKIIKLLYNKQKFIQQFVYKESIIIENYKKRFLYITTNLQQISKSINDLDVKYNNTHSLINLWDMRINRLNIEIAQNDSLGLFTEKEVYIILENLQKTKEKFKTELLNNLELRKGLEKKTKHFLVKINYIDKILLSKGLYLHLDYDLYNNLKGRSLIRSSHWYEDDQEIIKKEPSKRIKY